MPHLHALHPHPDVAIHAPVRREKGLPLPYVHYPGHYGAFMAFSAQPDDDLFFCACAEAPLRQYLRLGGYLAPDGATVLTSRWNWHFHLPGRYSRRGTRATAFGELFRFRPGLCHACVGPPPALWWSIQMYHNAFRRQWGWYVEQMRYRLGFERNCFVPEASAFVQQALAPFVPGAEAAPPTATMTTTRRPTTCSKAP